MTKTSMFSNNDLKGSAMALYVKFRTHHFQRFLKPYNTNTQQNPKNSKLRICIIVSLLVRDCISTICASKESPWILVFLANYLLRAILFLIE